MIEIKIILALTCREFDFEKVGYDGVVQEEVYDVSRRSTFLSPSPSSTPDPG